jgi:hypothetical protein
MKSLDWVVKIGGIVILSTILGACQSGSSLNADAGDDFSVKVGVSPFFDGCASTGDIVNYRWRILESPGNMPEDVGKIIREVDSECSFTLAAAMVIDEVGTWKIELEVRDNADKTSSDTVIVEVID